jgi:diguanylate cyclase (GGDEF)-like protein
MNILAITKHSLLVEHLRMAFEGAGHFVTVLPDALQALAGEAWADAHLILADGDGDPVDGYRLCHLLRGESRLLFQNLPFYLILEDPPGEEQLNRLREADADGFLQANFGLQQILDTIGPVVGGVAQRSDCPPVPVVAVGFTKAMAQKLQSALDHFRFHVISTSGKDFLSTLSETPPPIVLIHTDATGRSALARLAEVRNTETPPYTILIGDVEDEAVQRRLLLAGTSDWLPLPISAPRLLHSCRKGLEWLHVKRIQREYEYQIHDLRDRRTMLEVEAASLRSEVLTDPLTGLLNRRAFDQNLDHAQRQWERHHRSFALIVGDVDHFKLINDRFGHLVGDQVLRILAQRLRAGLRRSDLAFRIGGEEFAILLMETQLKASVDVAEKLRHRVDGEPVVLDSGSNIFPSMSFGVGVPDAQDSKNFFGAVDRALYMAKSRGRNCVVVADSKSPLPLMRPSEAI